MKIINNIIDYNFLNSFDINRLRESLVIPIRNDSIYFMCFVCKESDISRIHTNSLVKSYKLSKEEILFFLSDINNRVNLFNLILKSKNAKDINHTFIEEFLDILIKKSIDSRASDIHIESLEPSMIIRLRVDGILKIFYVFEKDFFLALSSYIKLISRLDITQIRLPQDGRFSKNVDEKDYDFRVSIMPTINGESIVIRVLDNINIQKNIEDLGFSNHLYKEFKDIVTLKDGLVLVSGPTGSGKSTTLYSLIKKFDFETKKIITIEDPVEYKLSQVQQISVNDDIGLEFKTVLKNILRQDPDIILIGEIRDKYSLDIALQASLTGHLVLASIHANSSIETLSRLIDLKADSYLLSTTLRYIISQRLVLNICEHCNKEGCEKCNFTGFFGRSSLCEVLNVDDSISSMIFEKKKKHEITKYLENTKFISMLSDGKDKVKKGFTTIDEVYKVVNHNEI
ncbi:GspE/PulE family protein [Arcobacter sp. LA11]|uniref:GspE/PulE family protein n=1 Tax=Arcobacter sp. LA11 TaxID=1898176 RepID=UPI000934878E|nr:GspE/PulE family protein [Arcobacter sp. LA11]